LNVKDLARSLDFYEKMGFRVIDGGHQDPSFKDTATMKWRLLENESVRLGLFQGMFPENILTFSPHRVVSVQQELQARGLVFVQEAVEDPISGHATAMLVDPDGNEILFDQE